MINELKRLCETREPVSIYANYANTSKFIFGYVLAVNEVDIAIQLISPNGDDDGFTVMNIDNILRIEEKCQYTEKMKILSSDKNIPVYDFKFCEDEIMESAVLYALNHNRILSVELVDSGFDDVVGFVDYADGGVCKINQIDEYGFDDGFSLIEFKNITKVTVMSSDERRIKKLWEIRN